jgi:hypothetical protein
VIESGWISDPWSRINTNQIGGNTIPNNFPLFDTDATFVKLEPRNDSPFQTLSFYNIVRNLLKTEPLGNTADVTLFNNIMDFSLPEHSTAMGEWMAAGLVFGRVNIETCPTRTQE